jgi:hypothetical protein
MSGPVVLIGAQFEENLSLRYLAAAVREDGLRAELIPFNHSSEADAIARTVVELDPLLVGISVPFQTRAPELLALADRLKESGVTVPVVVGGHFATFEYANILRDFRGVDLVVRHEGEGALRALCGELASGRTVVDDPTVIPGIVAREPCGGVRSGGKRPLPPLDELPFPDRRGLPHEVLGVPTAPVVGSRGCYADCAFCCIYAYAANAEGARYRMRSPRNIAMEMEVEYRERGVRLFIFHDDNFFVPSVRKNLDRYTALGEELTRAGMDDIGLVIKCRPNDVTREVFELLESLGVIRAYVGIETNSGEGIVSLNRRITPEANRAALELFDALDLYCSFNVLIFDPEATLAGVEANLGFMESFAHVPFNFCRAEVYAGTPLKVILQQEDRLRGDYLAWTYEMRDPRVELLFRIATTAFMARNFRSDGVANLNLGIRFDNEVLRRFYPECWSPAWHAGLVDLSRRIGLDSVTRMRDALAFAARIDLEAHEEVKAFTVDLARGVARADLSFVSEMKQRRAEMEQRIGALGVDASKKEYASGRAPWASETLRLSSSTGRPLSTEVLPRPTTLAQSSEA